MTKKSPRHVAAGSNRTEKIAGISPRVSECHTDQWNDKIVLSETSCELCSLFSRRRDLIYQVAILSAGSTVLLRLHGSQNSSLHAGWETSVLVSLFLAISVTLFCLRFIQIHGGIVHHGIRFAYAESIVFKRDLNQSLAAAARMNPRSVSLQIIAAFCLLSGLYTFLLLNYVGFGITICSIGAALVSFLLLSRAYLVHLTVCHWQLEQLQVEQPATSICPRVECLATEGDLRGHYIASLGDSYADMTCTTAFSGLQALAALNVVELLEEAQVFEAHVAGVLCSGVATMLGLIALRIYSRLCSAVAIFQSKLGQSSPAPYERSISDGLIGYLVTAAFAGVSIAIFVSVLLSTSLNINPQLSEAVGLGSGVVFVAIACLRR